MSYLTWLRTKRVQKAICGGVMLGFALVAPLAMPVEGLAAEYNTRIYGTNKLDKIPSKIKKHDKTNKVVTYKFAEGDILNADEVSYFGVTMGQSKYKYLVENKITINVTQPKIASNTVNYNAGGIGVYSKVSDTLIDMSDGINLNVSGTYDTPSSLGIKEANLNGVWINEENYHGNVVKLGESAINVELNLKNDFYGMAAGLNNNRGADGSNGDAGDKIVFGGGTIKAIANAEEGTVSAAGVNIGEQTSTGNTLHGGLVEMGDSSISAQATNSGANAANAYGVFLNKGSANIDSLDAGKLTMDVAAKNTGSGAANAYGIASPYTKSDGNAVAKAVDMQITAESSSNAKAYGLFAGPSTAKYTIADKSFIKTTAQGSGSGQSFGIYNVNGTVAMGDVDILADNEATGTGSFSHAIYNSGVTNIGNGVVAARAEGEGSVNVRAVQNNGGTLNMGIVDIIAENEAAEGDTFGMHVTAGEVNIAGGSLSTFGNSDDYSNMAIYASGDSVVNINKETDNKVVLNGSIEACNGSKININLNTADSALNGELWNDGYGEDTTSIKLNLAQGATWNVIDNGQNFDSWVDSVNMDNGYINMTDKATAVYINETTGTKGQVTIDDLGIGVKIGTNNDVAFNVSASEKLANTFGANLHKEIQDLADSVQINDGDKGKTIYIPESDVFGTISAITDENGQVKSYVKNANGANLAAANTANIALMSWRAENNDMNKRLGELRSSEGEHGL